MFTNKKQGKLATEDIVKRVTHRLKDMFENNQPLCAL
jgi:hypothetical protein